MDLNRIYSSTPYAFIRTVPSIIHIIISRNAVMSHSQLPSTTCDACEQYLRGMLFALGIFINHRVGQSVFLHANNAFRVQHIHTIYPFCFFMFVCRFCFTLFHNFIRSQFFFFFANSHNYMFMYEYMSLAHTLLFVV